jgi:hypothetical protein
MPNLIVPFGQPPSQLNSTTGNVLSNNTPADIRGVPASNTILQSPQVQAQYGSRFVVTNPTPGTGLQMGLITAFSDTTAAFIAFKNNDSVGGKSVYLDKIKLLLTGTAPATTTVLHMAVKIDSTSRTPTAGSPASETPVNPNGGSSVGSIVSPFNIATGGASITVPASGSNARLVSRGEIATNLGITGDEYTFWFGNASDVGSHGGGTAVRSTAAGRFSTNMEPVIVPPTWWCVITLWWLTQTTNAATFEHEVAWAEW